MNGNELRIALSDCIKSFGGGKNNPQFFGVKFGSIESIAHFSHKYNPDVRLDVTLNSDDGHDGELDGRFIERDEVLNFVESGRIDPEIRKDANVHLPEYRRNDYPLTWTFSKADINFVKSYAGAVRANSASRKFIRCATLHNYEGKIYLLVCEGHFLVARYLCEIEDMPCKLWGMCIPVEFFEFLSRIKAKEYRVEFNFNEYGKFDSYVSCHSDNYTVTAILDLTVTMRKFASDIMSQKKIRYNYMPVGETIDFLKSVHLTGKLAVSITRWDANEYNEPLVTGDSDCYWVCFLGEDDNLETFSSKDSYYKRLFELWDWWIDGGDRSGALEPFDNALDLSQVVADYDLQSYVVECI